MIMQRKKNAREPKLAARMTVSRLDKLCVQSQSLCLSRRHQRNSRTSNLCLGPTRQVCGQKLVSQSRDTGICIYSH